MLAPLLWKLHGGDGTDLKKQTEAQQPQTNQPATQKSSGGFENTNWLSGPLSSEEALRGAYRWHMFDSPEARKRDPKRVAKLLQKDLQEQQRDKVAEFLKASQPVGGGARPGAKAQYFNSPGLPSLTGKHPGRERAEAAIGPVGNFDQKIPEWLFDRPVEGLATGVDVMLEPAYGETFWQGMKRGLLGHGVNGWPSVFRYRDPVERRLAEHPTIQSWYGTGRNFTADMLLDPLNVLGPGKLLKYGRKGLRLLSRALRTRPGKVAALGLGLTGAGLYDPSDAESSISLRKFYPNALFFRGLDHRDPRAIAHALDVIDAFRERGLSGQYGLTELPGTIIDTNALGRAYPFGFLMDVPDASFIAEMSPRSMLSRPVAGEPLLPYAIGKRTGEPIYQEAHMARSAPGSYSPNVYSMDPRAYDLEDVYRRQRYGLDPTNPDRGNIFN